MNGMNDHALWWELNALFKTEMTNRGYAAVTHDNPDGAYTGCLAGAPLVHHRIVVMGINWGGDDQDANNNHTWDESYPPVSGQLLNEGESGDFGKQITGIFTRALGEHSAREVLNREVFWTNAGLVRSHIIADAEKQLLLTAAVQPSQTVLRRMLSVVQPRLILCFGCGNNHFSPSQFVLSELCHEAAWKTCVNPLPWYIGRSKIRRFIRRLLTPPLYDSEVEVWSFPHPARGNGIRIENCAEAMQQLGNSIRECVGI